MHDVISKVMLCAIVQETVFFFFNLPRKLTLLFRLVFFFPGCPALLPPSQPLHLRYQVGQRGHGLFKVTEFFFF